MGSPPMDPLPLLALTNDPICWPVQIGSLVVGDYGVIGCGPEGDVDEICPLMKNRELTTFLP
jgi:hypothetical protein